MTKAVPYYFGVVEKGKIKFHDLDLFNIHVRNFEGKEVRVAVQKRPSTNSRTLNQNAYYWAVVVPMIAEYMGESEDDAHIYLRWEFLKELKVIKKEGKTVRIEIARSTADLTTEEFSQYVDEVRSYAAVVMGVHIPDPDSVHF